MLALEIFTVTRIHVVTAAIQDSNIVSHAGGATSSMFRKEFWRKWLLLFFPILSLLLPESMSWFWYWHFWILCLQQTILSFIFRLFLRVEGFIVRLDFTDFTVNM